MATTLLGEFDEQLFIKQYHLHFLEQKRKSISKIVGTVCPITAVNSSQENANPPPKSKEDSGDTHFENLLVLFFNVSYYLGVVPHHFVITNRVNPSNTNGFQTEKQHDVRVSASKLHTVCVIIVHVCTILRLLMRFTLLSYNLRNPLNHFRIARTTLTAALCLYFMWSLWMRHTTCCKVLRRLANLNHFPNVTFLRKRSARYAVLFLMISLICATCVDRAIEDANRRWHSLCGSGSNEYGQQAFCQDPRYKFEHYLAKVVYIIFTYFGRVTKQFPRMDLVMIALTLWQACKSFRKYLEKDGGGNEAENTEKILNSYEELKEISQLFCELVGEMLICEIVEDIVYFSLEVQLRLRDADWFSILIIAETFVMAFLAKFVAACAAEHIQHVSKWLAKDLVLALLSPGKVITLHIQLSTNPIGMKGGSLFTLTKGFLAHVVTVWLTYFIILLQFEIEFD